MHYSVTDLLALFDNPLTEGSFSGFIEGIESLSQAKAGHLSFLTVPQYIPSPKYKAQVAASDASIILLPQGYKDSAPKNNQLYIRVANTSLALAKLCKQVEDALFPKPKAFVHPSAIIASSAQIDPTAHIGPLCVVEENAKIGPHTVLASQVYVGPSVIIKNHSHIMPHVSIYGYCEIGSRVRLHSGCVIGSDGYGYEFSNGTHQKVPQIGIVVIEDDVEIGANTTIDRARFGKTIIGQGSKIDNLVQVAHNVIIGNHCLLVSQVGVSGSTKLEDYVVAGGQVGFAGHLTIGKGTQIGAQSGIHTDLKPGSKVLGSPAHPFMQSLKIEALKKELPDLFKRVKTLEEKLPPPT